MADRVISLIKPYPAQQLVISNAKRNNLLVLSRRWGKSELAKYITKKTALTKQKQRCAWSAPTWKLFMETFSQFTDELAPATSRVSREDKRIELVNGSVIEFWSSDDTQAGRGRKYHLWVHDECQRQRDLIPFIRGSVRPTLADYQGSLYVLGTANGEGSEFHELYLDCTQDPSWQVVQGKLEENPFIKPEEIVQMRRDLGPELASQELDSQWVRIGDQTPLVRATQWETLVGVKDSRTQLKTLALDASVKGDLTAIVAVWTDIFENITYVDDLWLIEPDYVTKEVDYAALEEIILNIWRTGQYHCIAYDPYQTVSLMQRLKARGVRTVEFTQNSMRLKADGYLRQLINEGRLRHPGDPRLTEHVLACKLKYAQDNFRLVKNARDSKIDLAVALSMAVWTNTQMGQQSGSVYTPITNNHIITSVQPPSSPFDSLRGDTPWKRR